MWSTLTVAPVEPKIRPNNSCKLPVAMYVDKLSNSTSYGGTLIAYLCFISFRNSSAYTIAICLDVVGDTSNPGKPTNVAALAWIANRDMPARGQIISLSLQTDGNLVLCCDADPRPVWTSGTNSSIVKMELTMFHYNNGVDLCFDSGGRTLWESRAHPADALTDAQFLSEGEELVSWASDTDPAAGSYSLAVEPAALILYVNLPTPLPYWIYSYCTSNSAITTNTSCLVLHSNNFDYTGVNCAAGQYSPLGPQASLYTCIDFPSGVNADVENRTVLRLFLDGNLRAHTLQFSPSSVIQRVILLDLFSESQCNLPLRCGPYGVCTGNSAPQCACPSTNSSLFLFVNPSDPTQGCALANPLDLSHCSPAKSTLAVNASNYSVQMFKIQGLYYFANAFSLTPFQVTTEQNCSISCFHNCSCLAAFWQDHTQACFYAVDQIGSFQGSKNQSYMAYLKVNVSLQNPHISSQNSTSEFGSSNKKIVIALVASALVLLVAVSVFLVYFLHKRKRFMKYPTSDDDSEDAIFDSIPGLVPVTKFSFKELHAITNGFSDRLGKGGFGAVYAGTLSNGAKVAVKKLESARQGDKEFRSEIVIMGNIHHYNLLHLLGFCAKGLHRLLVYEYMENGSLDQWIFRKADEGVTRPPLSWDLRCKIALGAARGLAYLHHDCRERVLHLDIKPQNILLDKDFEAKVADFGLSRLMGRDKSSVVTTMRGTPGYLAPEWLRQGSIDVKCDVFSFGMLLMELVSGRKNLDHNVENKSQLYYPEWAFWEVISKPTEKSASLDCFTDAKLDSQEERNELFKIIMTAFLCVVDNPECRPSMAEVVQMLESFGPPVDVHYLASLHQEGSFLFLLSKNSFASDSNLLKRNDKPSHSSGGGRVSSCMKVSAR